MIKFFTPSVARWLGLVALVLAAAAFCLQLGKSFGEMTHVDAEAIGYGGMGSATVPYSDALGPWLHGGVSYYLRDEPTPNLYRPTVGLFFGSVLAATHTVAAIPLLASAVVLLSWIALSAADSGRKTIWLAVGLLLAAGYEGLVRPTNPETATVDMWALGFTLLGVGMIAAAQHARRENIGATLVGFVVLGVAACVRGPQIGAGALILLYLAFFQRGGWRWVRLGLYAAALFAPMLIDAGIRRHYGVEDNFLVTITGLYSDPLHMWTLEARARFFAENPSALTIAKNYLTYVFSPDGSGLLLSRGAIHLNELATALGSPWMIASAIVVAGLAWLQRGQSWSLAEKIVGLIGGAAWAVCLWGKGNGPAYAVLALTLGGLVWSAWRGKRLSVMFLLVFAGSLIVHMLLGCPGVLRVAATYLIFFGFGMVAALLENPEAEAPTRWRLNSLAVAAAVMVLCGYMGVDWIRPGARAEIREALGEANAVWKISDSERLDRSLYVGGDARLFYTRHDQAKVGAVRRFVSREVPAGFDNLSYVQPCAVIWREE